MSHSMKRMDFEGQEVAGVARVIHEKDKATCIDSIIWLTHMVELGVSVNLMKAILTFKASAEKKKLCIPKKARTLFLGL